MSRFDRIATRAQWKEVRAKLKRARNANVLKSKPSAALVGVAVENHAGRRQSFGKVAGSSFAFWRRGTFPDGERWWWRTRDARAKAETAARDGERWTRARKKAEAAAVTGDSK